MTPRASIVVSCMLLAAAAGARAQSSRCAECHFANMSNVPAPEHLGEWQRSAHAKHGVGCERCHGGDPLTVHPGEAHRGVVGSAGGSSPVNPASLPGTCAACHAREAASFSRSLHDTLLESGDSRAPTCSTCHGAMTARIPSPAAVETRCAGCHDPASLRAEYPAVARLQVEQIERVRGVLADVERAIARVPDSERRRRAIAARALAVESLNAAIAAVHAFDFRAAQFPLDEARDRAARLARDVR